MRTGRETRLNIVGLITDPLVTHRLSPTLASSRKSVCRERCHRVSVMMMHSTARCFKPCDAGFVAIHRNDVSVCDKKNAAAADHQGPPQPKVIVVNVRSSTNLSSTWRSAAAITCSVPILSATGVIFGWRSQRQASNCLLPRRNISKLGGHLSRGGGAFRTLATCGL